MVDTPMSSVVLRIATGLAVLVAVGLTVLLGTAVRTHADPAYQGTANLHVTKSVSPDPMVIGGESSYVVTVTNTGDGDAEDVVVTDQLDPNVSVGALPDGCSVSGRTVTCGGSGLTVPAGESVDFTIPVTVDPDVADGTDITNRAEVTASGAGDTSDSTQLITQTRTMTDVEITKSGPATANPDGTISYTVVVTNHGPSDAVDVTVHDPTNGQLTSIEELPEECPPSGLTVTCSLGTLAPGESRSLTLTVRVNPDVRTGTEIENCADVHTGSRESETGNNESCVTTEVSPSPEPSPTPTTSPSPEPTPSVSPEPTPSDPPGLDEPSAEPTEGGPDGDASDGDVSGGAATVGDHLPTTGGSIAVVAGIGALLVAGGLLIRWLGTGRAARVRRRRGTGER